MSADSHTVCPKCHPDLANYQREAKAWGNPGIIDHAAEDLGYDRSIRENYEFYIKATPGQPLTLVSEYSANCWDCGFTFTITHEDPIPGLEAPDA